MPEQDTAKIHVIRKTRQIDELDDQKKPTGKKIVDPDSLVVAFTYTDPHPDRNKSTTTFVAEASKNEFSMTPEQAVAAVESGGFVVSDVSKSEAQADRPAKPLRNVTAADIRPGETFSTGPAKK